MELHEGAIVVVVVTSVRDFGVLVRYGDREGVILMVNIFWDYEDVPKRMYASFEPGQQVRVKVLIDAPRQFSCSIKHLHPEQDPWWDPSIYVVGSVHQAFVKTIFDHGAGLLRLANGALVVVEQIRPGTQLKDEVSVVITAVRVDRQLIDARQN
jgi:ribosomal protein S1